MSLSNYPPGVSGNEPEIAGGHEFSNVRTHACDNESCSQYGVEDVEAEVDITLAYDTEYFEWVCPTCGARHDVEVNVEE
jgi:acetone carboxylase gamma subunit